MVSLYKYFYLQKQNNQFGQGLIEVLIALGIAVIFISASTISILSALNGAQNGRNENLATNYAQQGVEYMKTFKAAHFSNFDAMQANVNYCLSSLNPPCTSFSNTNTPYNNNCNSTGSSTLHSCNPIDNTSFEREINVLHATDAGFHCGAGANYEIDSTVSWADNKCKSTNSPYCNKVTVTACISNYALLPSETPTPTPTPFDSAACYSDTIPTTMTTNQTSSISITMQNNGTSSWLGQGNNPAYSLGTAFFNETKYKGSGTFTGSVAPGANIIFSNSQFSEAFTAPSTAGTYSIYWQMIKGGVAFGAACSKSVTVNPPCTNQTAYTDADWDRYGVSGATYCLTSTTCHDAYHFKDVNGTCLLPKSNALPNSTSPGTDCDDANANVFPGQTAWFTSPISDNSRYNGLWLYACESLTSNPIYEYPSSVTYDVSNLFGCYTGFSGFCSAANYCSEDTPTTGVPACGTQNFFKAGTQTTLYNTSQCSFIVGQGYVASSGSTQGCH